MDRQVIISLNIGMWATEASFSSWVLPTLALAYAIQFIIDTVRLLIPLCGHEADVPARFWSTWPCGSRTRPFPRLKSLKSSPEPCVPRSRDKPGSVCVGFHMGYSFFEVYVYIS